jgi:4-hydroxybenzoate polyprenyltransferase
MNQSKPRFTNMMKKGLTVVSWRNWGVLRYNSIWQNLAVLFYLSLVGQLYSLENLALIFLFIVFSTVMTAFGYLVNDLADLDLDRRQGKTNAFAKTGYRKGWVIVGVVTVFGILLGWPFLSNLWFTGLWLLWIFAAITYSLPPFRLKERGLTGLATTIAAQQTLPTAMLFAIFGDLFSIAALIFILFATVRGFSSDVSHQMREIPLDASTDTATFAVRIGKESVERIYSASLEAERMFLGLVVLLLLLDVPLVELPGGVLISPIWPLALIYLPLYVLTSGSSLRAFQKKDLEGADPYDEARQSTRRDALHFIHHTLPSVLLPLYLVLIMSSFYWPSLVFAVILFLLYGLYSPRRWKATWPLRPLIAFWRTVRN